MHKILYANSKLLYDIIKVLKILFIQYSVRNLRYICRCTMYTFGHTKCKHNMYGSFLTVTFSINLEYNYDILFNKSSTVTSLYKLTKFPNYIIYVYID